MRSQIRTASKENTVLTDQVTSRLPFWYSRGKDYTFYCEERLASVLFLSWPNDSFYQVQYTYYQGALKRGALFLGDMQNYQNGTFDSPRGLSLSSYYLWGRETRPHLPSWNMMPGHALFIVLYSFIFHTKNHIYCVLTFIIQGSVFIYNIFFIFRQRITWSSVYMKHLITIKHFK